MHYGWLVSTQQQVLLVTWYGSLAYLLGPLTPEIPTCPAELREKSAFSKGWVNTEGLLELMSTGVLISTMWRPEGEWTIRLRVFKAVVMENCPGPFLLDPGTLRSVGVLAVLLLGDEDARDSVFVQDD